jgi:hypothetical protein
MQTGRVYLTRLFEREGTDRNRQEWLNRAVFDRSHKITSPTLRLASRRKKYRPRRPPQDELRGASWARPLPEALARLGLDLAGFVDLFDSGLQSLHREIV